MGYDHILTIKSVDNQKINEIESFVREDLHHLLQSQALGEFSNVEPREIVGAYELDPHNFQFTPEERDLIFRIKDCVCSYLDLKDIGLKFDLLHITNNSKESDVKPAIFQYDDKVASESWIDSIRTSIPQTQTHVVLNSLLQTANQNALRKREGYRYSDSIKKFAVFFRIVAGPIAYETVQRNIECALPSLNTTNRYIHKARHQICEGALRSESLLKYLQERNLPLIVSLSEDATRIEGRVQFDPNSNQLVGFVPPINENTGMPKTNAYKARSTEEMIFHFSTATTSQFVNTIMAQPLANVPAFCLAFFGSDSKYSAIDVARRWDYIADELNKLGIIVVNWSSDSDPKYNSAMRMNSGLGIKLRESAKIDWYSCSENIEPPFYTQDTPHIGTKLRNLLLKTIATTERLPVGDYFIQVRHLEILIQTISKDKHRLTATTINPKDRQNFESVLKICDPTVMQLLKDHVNDSEGTVMFLQITLIYFSHNLVLCN